ncbi:MAG: hypothetical protein ACR2I0_09580 [Rhodoferax sp.]
MSVQPISGACTDPTKDTPELTDAGHCLPVLVGQVYAAASPTERGRMLDQLLKPLGVLALVAISNGVFARLTFANGWSRLTIQPKDTQFIDPRDVVALADRVQQVSMHAIEGLARVVSASPVLAGSAAAAMLLAIVANHHPGKTQARSDELDALP